MRVLIVEDDYILSEEYEAALGAKADSIDTARSIKDATQQVLRRHYDLVVLDLMLPDGNTSGLSDLIRLRNPGAAIISITGSYYFPYGQHSDMVNCDYFLRKPIEPEDLANIADYLVDSLNKSDQTNSAFA